MATAAARAATSIGRRLHVTCARRHPSPSTAASVAASFSESNTGPGRSDGWTDPHMWILWAVGGFLVFCAQHVRLSESLTMT